jgi:hypothetical protein
MLFPVRPLTDHVRFCSLPFPILWLGTALYNLPGMNAQSTFFALRGADQPLMSVGAITCLATFRLDVTYPLLSP